MSASNKLIQAKSLIEQLVNDYKTLAPKASPEDIDVLKDFLEGKVTVASVIRAVQNIEKTQTG